MTDLLQRIIPIVGLAIMVGGCLIFSTNRKLAMKRWDLIVWAVALQFIFALVALRFEPVRMVISWINDGFVGIVEAAREGGRLLFGPLMGGGVATAEYVDALAGGAEAGSVFNNAFVLATELLPTIIVFAAITTILYHLSVLQKVVYIVAVIMQKTLKTSGAETLCAAANIFVGQTEAPLVSKPFLARMTNSELMTIMTAGFATVAGSVLGLYVALLQGIVEGIAGHLIVASILSAPAALLFAKLLVPEEETPETLGRIPEDIGTETSNVLDAAASGTSDGLRLALNVVAVLISFTAIVALLNFFLGWGAGLVFEQETAEQFTIQSFLGIIFYPFALMLGIINPEETRIAAQLLGTKITLNEFVAFLDLAQEAGRPDSVLSERTVIIMSYALAGFANFASIGIQIGGIAALVPERRKDLSRLGFRAMLAGALAANATGCVVAIIL